MFWIIFGFIFFLISLSFLIYLYVRDRRYEKKSVVETMSPKLFDELAAEREESLKQAAKFKDALKKAAKLSFFLLFFV